MSIYSLVFPVHFLGSWLITFRISCSCFQIWKTYPPAFSPADLGQVVSKHAKLESWISLRNWFKKKRRRSRGWLRAHWMLHVLRVSWECGSCFQVRPQIDNVCFFCFLNWVYGDFCSQSSLPFQSLSVWTGFYWFGWSIKHLQCIPHGL